MKKLLIILVFSIGCAAPVEEGPTLPPNDSDSFKYYKDRETNLCFVLMDYKYSTMSQVPCTPEVESKIASRK